MVVRSISGASETSKKSVFSGGSSSSFKSLLAQAVCIFSGSQMSVILYPPSLDFKLSFCHDLVALFRIDHCLCILGSYFAQPMIECEVGVV